MRYNLVVFCRYCNTNNSYLLTYLLTYCLPTRLAIVLRCFAAVPGQPSNLQGVALSANAIQLSWDHPDGALVDNLVSYELYYNDSLERRSIHVTISPPDSTHLLTDLSPDTVYHIRLTAKSLRGEGVPTATIQVRTMEYGRLFPLRFSTTGKTMVKTTGHRSKTPVGSVRYPPKHSLKTHQKAHSKLNPVLVSCSTDNEIFYCGQVVKTFNP